MGDYLRSLQYATQQLELGRQLNDTGSVGAAYLVLGHDYREMGDYRNPLNHYSKAFDTWEIFHRCTREPPDNTYTILCIAETYLKMNNLDSAFLYAQHGYALAGAVSYGVLMLLAERILGDIYSTKGDDGTVLTYYRQNVPDYVWYKERNRDLGFVLNSLAQIFHWRNEYDSAIFYAKRALANADRFHDRQNLYTASRLLYVLNDSLHNIPEAFEYFKIAEAAKDSIASIDRIRQVQAITYHEEVREKLQVETDAKAATRTKLILIIASLAGLIVTLLVWIRVRQLRRKYKAILEQKELEKLKTKHEKEMLELEAKALRAQMNPHFIFNCMNSIKALIQEGEEDKAISYLTTFSKLIRTIFQNSDKREISLFDEIETCKLYTQLESMRFENKFSYTFDINKYIDLKSLPVPALIIQSFIENAIWHGIIPKDGGYVNISVQNGNEAVRCTIDDNGIGREMSKQNKFKTDSTHHSKGMRLTQNRLDLDNLTHERNASLEVIDKKSNEGQPTGTTVILRFIEV
ncbi:tetratricopeptide repeat-containing sensor histidine kinase [Foetidibacter luteolus]|uniref:tetratricopeptide repeat-containing sensor histidine kinase n=1 Tax=Foetidibacter luteolus TaxID=2608880 RepID=UPI00129AF33E|nr:histidine kinase [Foetidibacter luteolus]